MEKRISGNLRVHKVAFKIVEEPSVDLFIVDFVVALKSPYIVILCNFSKIITKTGKSYGILGPYIEVILSDLMRNYHRNC